MTLAGLIAGMNVAGTGTNLVGLLGLGIIFNFVAALWGCGVAIARLNPATVVLVAGRGLFAGSPVKVGLAFALLAASAALLAIFARRGLASAERAG